jgi:TolA-binding protein
MTREREIKWWCQECDLPFGVGGIERSNWPAHNTCQECLTRMHGNELETAEAAQIRDQIKSLEDRIEGLEGDIYRLEEKRDAFQEDRSRLDRQLEAMTTMPRASSEPLDVYKHIAPVNPRF